MNYEISYYFLFLLSILFFIFSQNWVAKLGMQLIYKCVLYTTDYSKIKVLTSK